MDIPNAVNIAVLGGCSSTTNFLHTFNHERVSHRADNGMVPSTQSYHLRACTLDEDEDEDGDDSEVMVVTREFESDRLENPCLLHCFGTGTEPPDGFIIVYDPLWSFSLDEAEGLLSAVVGASWGPRLVELEIIRRLVKRDMQSSSSSLALPRRERRGVRGGKKYSRFKYFPRLPYDLQLAVLRACLVSPDPIIGQKPHLNGVNTNLLLVNKFCYEEGGRIYKTQNRFLPLPPICLVADTSTRRFGRVEGDSGGDYVHKGIELANRLGVGFLDIPCESRSDVDGAVMGVVREFVARELRLLKYQQLEQRRQPKRSIRSVIGSFGIWKRKADN